MTDRCALKDLVSCEMTARWREAGADQFPEDLRNLRAAKILRLLEPQVAALEGSAIHRRLLSLCSIKSDCSDAINETLRRVGFGWVPRDATDLLDTIAVSLETRADIKHEDNEA